jgi:hypothetical protein
MPGLDVALQKNHRDDKEVRDQRKNVVTEQYLLSRISVDCFPKKWEQQKNQHR